ncbi:MAG: FKBP-type peptidyl-prolyl cis-trans isomerase [Bacteroidaceae bacterium]|nr:FKBP-type peptidyl-prolyl cis-trans isomerase [Bacteroidaceae bacterium]
MKKFFMMAAIAASAMAFTACNGSGSANLKDDVDSLTYDLGVAQSESLKQYMTMQLGVDSTYIDEFIKGMKEGAINEADPKKEAYMQGLTVGKQIQQMAQGLSNEVYAGDSTQTVNVNNLLAGFVDGLKGKAAKTGEEAMASFQAKLEPIKTANLEKQYGDNKTAGEKYLADNKKKDGVTVLPSGVQYKVLTEGTGALPTDTTVVKVNYEGKLIDGTVFDSSYERNQPFEVNMAAPRVIEGWTEILKLMPAGSKWEVVIPQDKAYGAQDMGQIKPFSTLIFTIEVLK